jgi:hypothetical protein
MGYCLSQQVKRRTTPTGGGIMPAWNNTVARKTREKMRLSGTRKSSVRQKQGNDKPRTVGSFCIAALLEGLALRSIARK